MKKTICGEFKWDCAHRLYNVEKTKEENKKIFGKCYNIHGHTYHFFVTVSSLHFPDGSDRVDDGMIINFTELKDIVNKIIVDTQDHYLNLSFGDPILKQLLNRDLKINTMDGETTCENQVGLFWGMLEEPLKQIGCQLEKLKLYETETSFATLKND